MSATHIVILLVCSFICLVSAIVCNWALRALLKVAEEIEKRMKVGDDEP